MNYPRWSAASTEAIVNRYRNHYLWAMRGYFRPGAPVYGWFREGFDTADLQDARTLLDALR